MCDENNEMRKEHSKSMQTIEVFEAKMQQALTDTKFWL